MMKRFFTPAPAGLNSRPLEELRQAVAVLQLPPPAAGRQSASPDLAARGAEQLER